VIGDYLTLPVGRQAFSRLPIDLILEQSYEFDEVVS
jgi:hypothetical protein